MNPRTRQEQEIRDLERKGWQHVDTIPLEAVNSNQSNGKYPQGSRWFWSTGAVMAPPEYGRAERAYTE